MFWKETFFCLWSVTRNFKRHKTDKCGKEKTEVLFKKRENVWSINHSWTTRKCRRSQICKHYILVRYNINTFQTYLRLLPVLSLFWMQLVLVPHLDTKQRPRWPILFPMPLLWLNQWTKASWAGSVSVPFLLMPYSSHQNWMISRFMNQHKFWWRRELFTLR